MAVSDDEANVAFYEFENMHSEYNSMEISQFENELWFRKHVPKKVNVAATTIDALIAKEGFVPDIIKVDVEGVEDKVVMGGQSFFKEQAPVVIIEYLAAARLNRAHQRAVKLLRSWGYVSFLISKEGRCRPVSDIENALRINGLNSDNIVFVKHSDKGQL